MGKIWADGDTMCIRNDLNGTGKIEKAGFIVKAVDRGCYFISKANFVFKRMQYDITFCKVDMLVSTRLVLTEKVIEKYAVIPIRNFKNAKDFIKYLRRTYLT